MIVRRLSLYADDSALFFSHRDPNVIANSLSNELSRCKHWLVDNRLSLHLGKTEVLLFGSKRRLKGVENFQVFCDGTPIERKYNVKYLGVLLDENLNGNVHAGNLMKACAGRLSFLYRNSSFLDRKSRQTLCASLIQPHIDYCCSSWYAGLTISLKKRLDVLQRKMVRFVYGLDPRAHVGNAELSRLAWLAVPDRVTFFCLAHLFKIKHKTAPGYLNNDFTPVSSVHSHNTRASSQNFQLSRDLALSQNSFAFLAAKEWNKLPHDIKSLTDLRLFKKRLKLHLFSQYD